MRVHMDIDTLDTDGALRETAAAAAGDTRAQFLAKAGLVAVSYTHLTLPTN